MQEAELVYVLGDSTTAFEVDRWRKVKDWRYIINDWEAAGFQLCSQSGKGSTSWVRQLESVPYGAAVVLIGGWNDKGVKLEEQSPIGLYRAITDYTKPHKGYTKT